MPTLTTEESILAWKATWEPSLVGKAIVNSDMTFRDVNQQFCKILGVTPAELIGMKFMDITPQPIRDLDLKNAKLVQKGLIDSYFLPKRYEMPDGRQVSVLLLVSGVFSRQGQFLFFVSQIMLQSDIPKTALATIQSSLSSQKSEAIIKRIWKGWPVILTLLSSTAALIAYVIKELNDK